ncbi:transcription factor Adf-1-like isoform X1 [Diorhabda sublineata]|uniref:transcription factor Adf-1-like isoform X1 n=1 Tax=Diorhabda sublineata TaxID=1163346 RepID=UPI0024E12891|nr:transcription factor Adf-1-like isoform X1 [Diorhabda sublineata]
MCEISSMDYDMKLIEEVKRYPELYDNSHRNFKNKELKATLWKDIAYKMRKQTDEYSVKTVRMRWKSLRDSYVKEIKYKMALSSGHNVKPRKNWRYSNCMTFLAPFLAISFPLTNNKQFSDESSEVIKEENEQAEQPYFIAVNSSQEEAANGHFLGALLDFSKQESPCVSAKSDDSDIDSFFKGVADTVKKFSAVNQVFIQRNIVNMVLDMKLREAHERMSHERNVSDND